MRYIQNPVLPGFHPDPSIVRVGADYYVATSTFEWFPGVRIHHSTDLVNWRPVARPLDRVSQLDMRGASDSGGVWAPCLTHADGLFWLCYTNVANFDRKLFTFETPNYVVTSKSIEGPWSEPVYMNSSGFDPSLFHDEDGRKWFLNMLWDHRKGKNHFAGIVLQEYSAAEKRLIGPVRNIFRGSKLGLTEGPHLYKLGGYYYLITAEGGTSYGHSVTVARSRRIEGPYELDPGNPMLTAGADGECRLQKAGHASLVETQTREWYLAHLCGRPLKARGRCPLGRETALQKVVWNEEGWLRLDGGGTAPREQVPAPGLPERRWPEPPARDDFDSKNLDARFQTLRVPLGPDTLSLSERPGFLRLKGRNFLTSRCEQAFVARRQTSFRYVAATCVEFEPEDFQQMAGLTCFYDTGTFFYLRVSRDEKLGKCLNVITGDRGSYDHALEADVSVEGWKRVFLRADVNAEQLRFSYSPDGQSWKGIGPSLDASKLSDEYASDLSFTGAFVGVACQDLSGRRQAADFDYFEYSDLK